MGDATDSKPREERSSDGARVAEARVGAPKRTGRTNEGFSRERTPAETLAAGGANQIAAISTGLRAFVNWLLRLAAVGYIALIGIFAIEELNGRERTLQLIEADEARIGTESPSSASPELQRLRALHVRLTTLSAAGALEQGDRLWTLREISCEYDRLRDEAIHCPIPPERSDALFGTRVVLLRTLNERARSGDILGVLIITASIGGALITMSLRRSPAADDDSYEDESLKSVLRAIGGGIVCYLAIDGGSAILGSTDLSRITHPATASLYGLLAGMFSQRVFTLLRDMVVAFVERVTPDSAKRSKPSAAVVHQNNADAEKTTPEAAREVPNDAQPSASRSAA